MPVNVWCNVSVLVCRSDMPQDSTFTYQNDDINELIESNGKFKLNNVSLYISWIICYKHHSINTINKS